MPLLLTGYAGWLPTSDMKKALTRGSGSGEVGADVGGGTYYMLHLDPSVPLQLQLL